MGSVSLQPKQFRQQTLWPAQAETTHVQGSGQPIEMGTAPGDRREDHRGTVEFLTRQPLDNGGQVTSWRSQYQLERYGTGFRQAPTNTAREAELDSGQTAMFMTPREIHQRWQPLDGDRLDGWDGTYDGTDTRSLKPRGDYGEPLEEDDELWERKLQESQMSRTEYAMHHRGLGMLNLKDGTGTETFIERDLAGRSSYPRQRLGEGTDSLYDRQMSYIDPKVEEWRESKDASLYDRIAAEGVRNPIHLGEVVGSMGKPQVAGGHHRLAAQTDINQDRLMPVLHHRNTNDAKANRYYPYS